MMMTLSAKLTLLFLTSRSSPSAQAFHLISYGPLQTSTGRRIASPVESPSSQSHHRHPPRRQWQQQVSLYSSATSPDDTTTSLQADLNHDWEEEHHHHNEEEGEHDHDDGDGDGDGEEEDDDDDSLLLLNEEYQQWNKAIERALKALQKKQTSLENEWSKAQKVEETVARAQLIVNNLYLFNQEDTVHYVIDWEKGGEEVQLQLDPQYESASAEADALFAQARKLKRGSQVVQELLQEVEQARQILQDCRMDLQQSDDNNDNVDEGRLRLVQDRLRRTAGSTQFQEPKENSKDDQAGNQHQKTRRQQQTHNKKPPLGTPASNVRKLVTPAGATVLVGRNRRGNEYLSLTYARGNDVWMHARGTPGAHVLVLDRRGSVHPTEECLEFAAHLAAFYSDGRSEIKVPVTLAEPKHLLKPRGAPLGAVKLRQEGQVLYGCPEMVPIELQEARAQSGVYASEEYRSADKAKHRKHTQKMQEEKQQQKQKQRRKRRRNHGKNGNDSDE